MQPIRISIVEDIPEIREGLKSIVQGENSLKCVNAYATASEAYTGLTDCPPDIVIMDINLPDSSGLVCMQKVKALHPDILFMIFTIYEDSEQIFQALSLGASGYLLKNTSPERIVEALHDLYNGGAPMSASIAKKVILSFQSPINEKPAEILSAREHEVLVLLSKGLFYKEIAEKLFISVGTVRQHIHHIYKKLQVQNRTEAINKLLGKTL
jgi:DNA-binding NarL/FixJ family response regulator